MPEVRRPPFASQSSLRRCRSSRSPNIRPARPQAPEQNYSLSHGPYLSTRQGPGGIHGSSVFRRQSADLDTAIGQAVTGLRDFGYSWADIGLRLGVSRQAAQQRWGQPSRTAP
jgi:hypothetical protein